MTGEQVVTRFRQTFARGAVGYQAGMLTRTKQTRPWLAFTLETAEQSMDAWAWKLLQGEAHEAEFEAACQAYITAAQSMIHG